MNIKDIRRENLRYLANLEGGVSALAKRLNKTQSQMSHVIGIHPIKNIGDRLASEAEKAFKKPPGWLDQEHTFDASNKPNHKDLSRTLRYLPLIYWEQLNTDLEDIATSCTQPIEHIPTSLPISQHAFVVNLPENKLSSELNEKLFANAIMVIEPKFSPQDGELVLASLTSQDELVIRKFKGKEKSYELLGIHENLSPISHHQVHKIVGTIRQILINL